MSLGYPDPRLANSTTGIYLQRTFNIEPKETRFMPGIGKAKNSSERLRMGIDCDEVYPGIIIGKKKHFLERNSEIYSNANYFFVSIVSPKK